tara:strand:- start:426 stop:542 length:117 start_codon:yes stop_codon:yes gene_type:complete
MNFQEDYLDMIEEAVSEDVMTDSDAGFLRGFHFVRKAS